eukprot:GHVN01018991.1.p1 GENE.GHVN01018991.1~~GHVN01018991.1.p1  ORF type:complete len:121 (+),score=6.95 GHVN01018991.1:79-441(+)
MVCERRWTCTSTIQGCHARTIYSVDWSHQHNWIASVCSEVEFAPNLSSQGGEENMLRIFRQPEETKGMDGGWYQDAAVPDAHKDDVNGVAWGPGIESGSQILATCGDDNYVRVWKIRLEQ